MGRPRRSCRGGPCARPRGDHEGRPYISHLTGRGGHRLNFFKRLAAKLGAVLAVYGGWGLVAISALDSSVVPMPAVNDLLLIHLSAGTPFRMPLYVLTATIGSVLGAFVMFSIGFGGRHAIYRNSGSFDAWRTADARLP